MFVQKVTPVHAANKRQYTAANGEVQGGTGRLMRTDTANEDLCELYGSVVTKWELSNTAKLSAFKSVFVPIFTYGYESLVLTESCGRDGILRTVHGVTVRDKVRSCEIRKDLNVEPLRIKRSQLRWFTQVIRTPAPTKFGETCPAG